MVAQTSECSMSLRTDEQNVVQASEDVALGKDSPKTLSKHRTKEIHIQRLLWGGLIFLFLTVGIFWYQFSKIGMSSEMPMWNQLQWGYFLLLLLFIPIDTFAASLRIWVICRKLQPGVSLWNCLKADLANLGLAMLTPSQTGGGLGQVYMLSRGGVNLGTALSISLITFLGSMVVLLFIGLYALFISEVDYTGIIFQGAFLIFFFIFVAIIFAVCSPGSLRSMILWVCKAFWKSGGRGSKQNTKGLKKNTCTRLLANQMNKLSVKLIDLCWLHQVNMRRFFILGKSSFIWVCFLSFVFMLSRSIIAFLCLRFLGIQASSFADILETQLGLIFLIYFAPTPGSAGLAEGASMVMMDSMIPTGFVPYYNLLWRCSTLYLPSIVGLILLSWALMQDARKVLSHR